MSKQAELLYQAYLSNQPLDKGRLILNSREHAYQVQNEVLALKEKKGEVHKGYKISLTSQETQKLFNSDSPLYGQMTDVTIKNELSLSNYNEPLVEVELIFLIDETVNASDSKEEVMAKCRVAPGLEVPDGRYSDWFPKTTFYEVIADGAVNGALAMGDAITYTYKQLADVEGVLFLDGEEVKRGHSTEVLGHPVNSVKWLAKELELKGEKLTEGLFVSSGTFVLPEHLEVGTYTAKYKGVGEVTLVVKP